MFCHRNTGQTGWVDGSYRVPRGGSFLRRLVAGHFFAFLVTVLFSGKAYPNNGLNLIGFGPDSVGMGGADLAVARDTAAMNTNPAGIVQIVRNRIDLYGAVARSIDVSHSDSLGNDAEMSNPYGFQAGNGIVLRIGNSPFTAGIGIFGQGGAGNAYKDLLTPFGTRDELSAQFLIAKFTPTIAYSVSESLSLGLSLQAVYSSLEQKIFPNTSFVDNTNPSRSFFGLDISGLKAISPMVKFGALYRAGNRWSVGLAYSTRAPLTLSDGEAVVNMTAAGLGKVTYRDARVEGMGQPQELGLGVSFRPVPALLLAADASWIDWSGSMKSSTLTLSNPDNPSAPPVLTQTSALDWKDQYVFALGLAWDLSDRVVLRAGYNYGKNPIPSGTVNPLLPAYHEQTLTCGAGYAMRGGWKIDAALEYMLDKKVTYDNPSSPLGSGATEEWHVIGLMVMVGKTW